jgi:seryl-tRNA synthetase
MHDIKWIRDYPQEFDKALKNRGQEVHAERILALDKAHRSCIVETQALQQKRNDVAKQMGLLRGKGEETAALVEEGTLIKNRLADLEAEERSLGEKINFALSSLPNIQKEDVPVGKDETFNQTVRVVGTPPTFSFEPKEHFELGEGLTLMSFEDAARLSGSRFVVLKGALARLERAIAQFMLDTHVNKFGYTEVSPPLLVTSETMFGTGQLPNLGEDSFQTQNHWLIPTAEVPLTNLVAQTIMEESALPLRFVGHTPCFRSEAGASGKDTRGMLRQHQFYKVELVSIVHPDQSMDELERMTSAAEEILKQLKLPYRVQLLCTGDAGFCSEKTYDLEVWLPGQNQYREISSCSSCGPFQARRMNARFRSKDVDGQKQKPQFVHTLNGSGLAVGRTLIAILENYQQEDGSIRIPDVLHPYMNGLKEIRK